MNGSVHAVAALLVALVGASARPAPAFAQSQAKAPIASAEGAVARRGGPHDFDFEIGSWKANVSRLLHPLTGSTTWVDYEGTSVVRTVWDGRANLGELEVNGPAGRIEGLTLRLYDATMHQWNISWANAADPTIGPPMKGGFMDGRGVFYNEETLNGRPISVRFVFSDITPTSFRFEQAFSPDSGKTWEVNWRATFTR